MNQYQKSNIYHSPTHYTSTDSYSTIPRSPQTLSKKGCQSVTHYMYNKLPHCINHKRRKAYYYISLAEGDLLYFCERCRDLVLEQGFCCKSIREFDGIGQNFIKIQRQAKQRKESLEQYLCRIKSLNTRTNRCQIAFQSNINEQLSNNSKQIYLLFQRLQTQICTLKQAYQQQMQKVSQNAQRMLSQMKFSLTWTQEQLQYLIHKIIMNTNRLIQDKGYFAMNAKQLQESLIEKQKKILTAQLTYKNHAFQFKSICNSTILELAEQIQNIQSVIHQTKTLSNIVLKDLDDRDEGVTCRQLIVEMTRDNLQNQQ